LPDTQGRHRDAAELRDRADAVKRRTLQVLGVHVFVYVLSRYFMSKRYLFGIKTGNAWFLFV
jgi:hypothetical protein